MFQYSPPQLNAKANVEAVCCHNVPWNAYSKRSGGCCLHICLNIHLLKSYSAVVSPALEVMVFLRLSLNSVSEKLMNGCPSKWAGRLVLNSSWLDFSSDLHLGFPPSDDNPVSAVTKIKTWLCILTVWVHGHKYCWYKEAGMILLDVFLSIHSHNKDLLKTLLP